MPTGSSPTLPITVTMGEPAGIGGEIALRAWRLRNEAHLPPFFLLDDPSRLNSLSASFGWVAPPRTSLPCSDGCFRGLPHQPGSRRLTAGPVARRD